MSDLLVTLQVYPPLGKRLIWIFTIGIRSEVKRFATHQKTEEYAALQNMNWVRTFFPPQRCPPHGSLGIAFLE